MQDPYSIVYIEYYVGCQLQEMYQKKWDALLGKAAKCPRCFFDIELDGEKVHPQGSSGRCGKMGRPQENGEFLEELWGFEGIYR